MFGRFRKKVTRQTIEMVKQPYAIFQSFYGIPPGFWQDEFVLGFFGVMIGLVSELRGQGRLSQLDKGHLLQETFSSLSNMNGIAIARRFSDLAHQQPHSDDFKLGGDHAEIVTLALLGKVTPAGREIVERAKTKAAAQGEPGDTAVVGIILARELFIQPLIERFGLSDGF